MLIEKKHMAKSINTKNKNYGKKAEIFFYLGLFCFVFAVAMLIGLAAKGTFSEKLNDAGIALSAVVGVFGVLGIILLIVAYIYSVKNKKYLKYLQETKEKEKLNAADSTNKPFVNVIINGQNKQQTPTLQNPNSTVSAIPVKQAVPVSSVVKPVTPLQSTSANYATRTIVTPNTTTRSVVTPNTVVRPTTEVPGVKRPPVINSATRPTTVVSRPSVTNASGAQMVNPNNRSSEPVRRVIRTADGRLIVTNAAPSTVQKSSSPSTATSTNKN